jgi:hypothetical protein
VTTSDEEVLAFLDDAPRRRVIIRPAEYEEERLALRHLRGIVERTRVQLRGWDFPHLSHRGEESGRGDEWIASWSSFLGHREYWRMYQSGQFVHRESIRETVEEEWGRRLRQKASWFTQNEGEVEGFFDFINFLYSMTEVFEFAANLCQTDDYPKGSVVIHVGFHDIQNFGLSTAQFGRDLSRLYRTSADTLQRTWEIETAELISASAELSLNAVVWFFERFQWDEQPVDVFREEQRKFLAGLI